MELMQANKQWSSRPADERFTSLVTMQNHFQDIKDKSRETVVSSRKLEAVPLDSKSMLIHGPNGHGYAPTNWAFGQLAQLAEAPAGYLRTLPAPIAADAINYGLQFKRGPEDVGVLLHKNGESTLRAATGPKYGRIWNADVMAELVKRFGNGLEGRFRVPGIRKQALTEVTTANTTLYGSDRDYFIFLTDEANRIELPNRRNGEPGSLARGFFLWGSEVGKTSQGWATFLFDEVCENRIVWGAEGFEEVRIRHTASAPDRWLDEVLPAIKAYAESDLTSTTQALKAAQEARLGDKLDAFLANRFGARTVEKIKTAHLVDEGRPMETVWDVVTGATAFARSIQHQDARIEVERKAGDLLKMAA